MAAATTSFRPSMTTAFASITILPVDGPLPAELEIETTINADEGHRSIFGIILSDRLTNGFVVFDYHDTTDFKFAGADMDADQWVIGHRDATGWHTDAVTEPDH